MKIKDIFEEKMLTEAVNFRTEQVRHILANIQDFRFGTEYEFKINDEHLSGGSGEVYVDEDALYSEVVGRQVEDYFNGIYQSDLIGLIESIYGVYKNKGSEILSAFVEAYDYDDSPEELRNEFQRILNIDGSTLNTITSQENTIENLRTKFRNVSYEIKDMFFDELAGRNFEPDNFEDSVEEIYTSMSAIKTDPSFENVYEVVKFLSEKEVFSKIEGIYGDLTDFMGGSLRSNQRAEIGVASSMLASHMISTETGREITDEERYSFAEEYARENNRNSSDGGEAVSFIASHFEDLPWVEDVVADGSFSSAIGGELITKPLTFPEMITRMKEVFAFIREYGYTDDQTGMHVNISHKRFKTIERMDLLKMVVLLDPDYMQNEGLGKWKERNDMVRNLYRQLTPRFIQSLAVYYTRHGISKVEEEMRNELIQPQKFRSVNFTNSFGYVNAQERRIEYRLFGGSGYESRLNDASMDILFACYTVLAAMDENFLRREYLEHLMKVLNRYSYAQYQMSFIELARRSYETSQTPSLTGLTTGTGEYRVGLNQKINQK